jgi:hypothetical protein
VIERDNQVGTNARIKRIYSFSIAGLEPQPQGGAFPLVEKTLVRDLMPDLERPEGLVLEKVGGSRLTDPGVASSSRTTMGWWIRPGKLSS